MIAAHLPWATRGTTTQAASNSAPPATSTARPEAVHESSRSHEHEREHTGEGEVTGLEVEGRRSRNEQRRRYDKATLIDRAPRQSPGERKRPHRPELAPKAVAAPEVTDLLVAHVCEARDEGRDHCRGQRCAAAHAEDAGRAVDANRPAGNEQPRAQSERPPDTDRPGGERGHEHAEALVLEVLRRPEIQEREPRVGREMPGPDLREGEADHLLVHGRVVQIRHLDKLGAQQHK